MEKYASGKDAQTSAAGSTGTEQSGQPQSDAHLNLADFALKQDYAESKAQKLITVVPVRRPDKMEFFRAHPDPNYRYPTLVLEVPWERDDYLVHPSLRSIVPEASPVLLVTCVTRDGAIFFWPAKLPKDDKLSILWSNSAMNAVTTAEKTWIRVKGDKKISAYDVTPAVASDQLPPPDWSDYTFQQLFDIAFKDRVISDPNHIVLRRLRGEI
jgi:hypothetical protein